MASKERLYEAFGELIYSVCLADGLIQPEEMDKLNEVLLNHPWGQEIKWSFNYEHKKSKNPSDSYEKALDVLKQHGPDPEYNFLVEILEQIAAASDGIDENEKEVIEGFQKSLREHFMLFLDDHNLI